MKFLIDRCAGHKIAIWLRNQGHDVLESRELGPDPGDLALLEMAVRENRIIITIDTDFGTIVYRDKAQHCGMVRLPDVPSQKRIELMQQILERHESDLDQSAVITVQRSLIRITQKSK